jgi:23S rRNA (guanosine2251-2'-O)-methyltransferase
MVERYRRGKRKRPLLGSHQKCWIWGRNVVWETLESGVWPIVELYTSDQLDEQVRRDVERLSEAHEIPALTETTEQLTRRCRSSAHQGFVAKMTPFPYADAGEAIDGLGESPLAVVLDSIQDPFNFGAVIRSAEVLGAEAMFVSTRDQAEVSSLVARTSAGAVNRLPISQSDDLAALVPALKDRGLCVVAAAQSEGVPVEDVDLTRPTAFVIGNEGCGIRPELFALCDESVTIPQAGHVESLNAAVSAGILFYEAGRQRRAFGQLSAASSRIS